MNDAHTASGAQLPGDGQLPLAPVLHASSTAGWVMTIGLWAGVAVTLGWALWMLMCRRDELPLILFVASVIAANMEPLGDTVGQIVYATNLPWFDYKIMGREMPSFILMGLSAYMAPAGYY